MLYKQCICLHTILYTKINCYQHWQFWILNSKSSLSSVYVVHVPLCENGRKIYFSYWRCMFSLILHACIRIYLQTIFLKHNFFSDLRVLMISKHQISFLLWNEIGLFLKKHKNFWTCQSKKKKNWFACYSV